MDIKQERNQVVYDLVSEAESYIQSWNIPKIEAFTLEKIVCDYSPRRRASRGGMYTIKGIKVPGINIAMDRFSKPDVGSVYRFLEYSSFDNDPIIGGFYTDTIIQVLQADVIHEIAHAVQFWQMFQHSPPLRWAPHGIEFKKYYSKLRTEFINPNLPEQNSLQQKYKELINYAVKKELLL